MSRERAKLAAEKAGICSDCPFLGSFMDDFYEWGVKIDQAWQDDIDNAKAARERLDLPAGKCPERGNCANVGKLCLLLSID